MDHSETIKVTAYKCELCLKEFCQKSSRNRHVREQHLQPGSYKCRQCRLRFSKKYNLQTHVDHVHPKKIDPGSIHFKCSECTCTFSTTAALKKHIKFYHNKKDILEIPYQASKPSQETDPQSIADSVLMQLKQLQNDINTTEHTTPSPGDNKQGLTSIETAHIKEILIKDSLYPSDQFKLVKVQTIQRINGSTYLICEFCSKEFYKTFNYLRHLRIHTRVRPYICVLCKKSFPTTAQLKSHCSIHKLNETFGVHSKFYKCPHCQEGFSAINRLDKHLSNNNSQCSVTFKCPECFKSFKTLTNILRHKHNSKDKELHLLKTLLPKPLSVEGCKSSKICHLCGLQFNSIILLHQHEKRHENLSKYQCLLCKQSYATLCSLKIHSKSHNKAKIYKCQFCLRMFTSAQNCRSHMMTHLKQLINTPKELSKNNEHLKRFSTIVMYIDKTLLTEISIITKEKPTSLTESCITRDSTLKYKCSECNKAFRYQAWLKKHFQYKHASANVSNYECLECSRKFRTKQSLKTHYLTHSEDEREKYTCQVCGRQYGSTKSLKLHLRIHTEEKPFQCEECLKQFRTSGHLIQHRKSNHSG